MSRTRTRTSLASFPRGVNTSEQPFALAEGEALLLENVIAKPTGGFIAAPGFCGLTATAMFNGTDNPRLVRAFIDNKTNFLVQSGVNADKNLHLCTRAGVITQVYTLTSNGYPMVSTKALDKWFIACQGERPCVWNGTTVNQLGIDPPAGVSAAAAAGGSLPDGVYKIFAGYAIESGSTNVLYSTGQAMASDITLGSGNNTISITSFANSSDSRVNNKVIWMTDAGGTVYYLYYHTGNNTTTSFSITSASGKVSTELYTVKAASNITPPSIENIVYANGRLWGNVGNVVYYSLKSVSVSNPYDLERWYAENYIEYPFDILSMFVFGNNLYFNTPHGLIMQPECDPTIKYEIVDTEVYYLANTFVQCNAGMIGLTTTGVRVFNGTSFSPSISTPIDCEITTKIAASATYNACIFNRVGIKEEYQLVVGTVLYVCDTGSITAVNPTKYTASWETRTTYWNLQYDGVFYKANPVNYGGTFCVENVSKSGSTTFADISETQQAEITKYWNADYRIHNAAGTFISSVPTVGRGYRIKTPMRLISNDGIAELDRAVIVANHSAATVGSTIYLYIYAEDYNGLSTTEKIKINYQQATTARTFSSVKLPPTCQGRFVAAMISSTELQMGLQIADITVEGIVESSRATQ